MSKGKVYKKKSKLGGNVFVILGVILALLIVATVIFTSIDNSKFNGLMEDYYEFTYGEKKNIKLTKMQDPNTGMILYSDNEYAYYVEDDIIYDTTRTEAEVEGFKAKVTELSADFGEVTTSNYAEYIDGKDFSKEYAYVQIAATYDGVLGSTDAAAEKIAALIDALNEEYNICGLYVNYSDSETFYYTSVDVTGRATVTIDMIKENIGEFELTPVEKDEVAEGEAEAETAEDETAE